MRFNFNDLVGSIQNFVGDVAGFFKDPYAHVATPQTAVLEEGVRGSHVTASHSSVLVDGHPDAGTHIIVTGEAEQTAIFADHATAVTAESGQVAFRGSDQADFVEVENNFENLAFLYQAGLGRMPDLHGSINYAAHQPSLNDVAAGILNSQEFANKFGNDLSAADLVRAFYVNLRADGETPEHELYQQAEIDHWENAFNGFMAQGQDFATATVTLLNHFAYGQENKIRHDETVQNFLSTSIVDVSTAQINVHTGDGNDTVFGGTQDDTIVLAAGNDVADGGLGADLIIGGAGHDMITTYGNGAEAQGGTENDTLIMYGDDSKAFGGADDDIITTYGNNAYADGGVGNDTFNIHGDGAQVHGGTGTNIYNVTDANATIVDNGDGTINYGDLFAGQADGARVWFDQAAQTATAQIAFQTGSEVDILEVFAYGAGAASLVENAVETAFVGIDVNSNDSYATFGNYTLIG